MERTRDSAKFVQDLISMPGLKAGRSSRAVMRQQKGNYLIVSAWNNGEHHESGAGYGLEISAADRDAYFNPNWQSVILEIQLDDRVIDAEVNVMKKFFWDPNCGELIKKEIGRWIIGQGYARWPRGHPPRIELIPVGGRRFSIRGVVAA